MIILRFALGSSLGTNYCFAIRLIVGTTIISAGMMILELFAIRYLYTTCWQNLGITHIDFWKFFFHTFNGCMFFWVGIVLSRFKLEMSEDMAICNNVKLHDVSTIYEDLVSTIRIGRDIKLILFFIAFATLCPLP